MILKSYLEHAVLSTITIIYTCQMQYICAYTRSSEAFLLYLDAWHSGGRRLRALIDEPPLVLANLSTPFGTTSKVAAVVEATAKCV